MKKLVLTAIAVAVLPTLLLAQGTITFGSATANQYVQYENLVKAEGAQAQLWWSPDNILAYTQIATAVTGTGAAAGYIAPSVLATTPAATAGGAVAWFRVAAVEGLYAGSTNPFQVTTGNPTAQPPTTPGSLDGWTSPITMTAVPEPGIIALAGLGMASLLIFRRRK